MAVWSPWEERGEKKVPFGGWKARPLSELTVFLRQALQAQPSHRSWGQGWTQRVGWRCPGALILVIYATPATQAALGQSEVLGTRAGTLVSSCPAAP